MNRPSSLSMRRRSLLKAGVASASLAAGAYAPVFAQTRKVKFTLSWVAEGAVAYLYVALNKGYWKKLGLDVEIARGSGSAVAAEAVGAGRFDFGVAGTHVGILQSAKGLPITSLAVASYDAGLGLCTLAESGIATPKDLEGKTLASTVASVEYPFIPVFAKNAGLDLSKVKRVAVDAQLRQKTLIQKQVEAISGALNSMVPTMVAQGVKTKSFPFSRYGLELYGSSIVTQPRTLAAEPGVCEAIVQGAMEGLAVALTDPEATLAAFAAEVKETGISPAAMEQARISLGLWANNAIHAEPMANGLGYANPKTVASMTDLVMEYLAAPGTPRPAQDQLSTNRFAGKVRLSPAQWAAAKETYKSYAAYLA